MPSPKGRRFSFTLWLDNTDYSADYEGLEEALTKLYGSDGVRYVIGQLESAPNTGRIHGQCYVEFTRPFTGARIRTYLGVGADCIHYSISNGDCASNIAYCSKEESRVQGTSPVILGEPGIESQGTRTDLQGATDVVKQHGVKRLADELPHMYVKYHKGFEKLESLIRAPNHNFTKRSVIVRYGTIGVGKTRWAYETYSESEGGFYSCPPFQKGAIWFDGYREESTVLFDDYGGDNIVPIAYLLRLLDGYPVQVPYKGGFHTFNPRTVIFTSNIEPRFWYPKDLPTHVDALMRRITDLQEMTLPPVVVNNSVINIQ